jgi:hypothetical protein
MPTETITREDLSASLSAVDPDAITKVPATDDWQIVIDDFRIALGPCEDIEGDGSYVGYSFCTYERDGDGWMATSGGDWYEDKAEFLTAVAERISA